MTKTSNVLDLEEVELEPVPESPGHIKCSVKRLTTSEAALKFSGVGYQEYDVGGYATPHSHEDREQIYYLTKGKGVMTLGDEEFEVKAGTVALIPLKMRHSLRNTGTEPLGHLLFEAWISPTGKEG